MTCSIRDTKAERQTRLQADGRARGSLGPYINIVLVLVKRGVRRCGAAAMGFPIPGDSPANCGRLKMTNRKAGGAQFEYNLANTRHPGPGRRSPGAGGPGLFK
ncbi:hypothetical protein EVAR_19383_1 [Eumeta japonica]|uniref:Uncharacterized protein n=1 Tax=Eumeta variegata TaxID=151549 RepID=A0A4C1TRI6_EUMVA|nr:hypothetical protein EVAR_19383_1 [Eumeta japonica]